MATGTTCHCQTLQGRIEILIYLINVKRSVLGGIGKRTRETHSARHQPRSHHVENDVVTGWPSIRISRCGTNGHNTMKTEDISTYLDKKSKTISMHGNVWLHSLNH